MTEPNTTKKLRCGYCMDVMQLVDGHYRCLCGNTTKPSISEKYWRKQAEDALSLLRREREQMELLKEELRKADICKAPWCRSEIDSIVNMF